MNANTLSVGDRVGHRDVKGLLGRVLTIEADRALVRWDGYGASPWTPLHQLLMPRVVDDVYVHESRELFDRLFERR